MAKESAAQKKKREAAEAKKNEQENGDDMQKQEAEQVQEGAEKPEPYTPKRTPLKAANLDQQAAYEAREAERAAQREVHNRRTGGVTAVAEPSDDEQSSDK